VEAVLLVTQDVVGFRVCGAGLFNKVGGPKLKQIVHEYDRSVVIDKGGISFLME
jgi:hypothetical protein